MNIKSLSNSNTSGASIDLSGFDYRFPTEALPPNKIIDVLKKGRKSSIHSYQTLTKDDAPVFELARHGKAGFHEIALPHPKADEVTVTLDCVNLTTIDLHANDTDTHLNGYFATGIISAVGYDVTDWNVGDPVILAADGNPASHVVCSTDRIFSASCFKSFAAKDIAALTTTLIPAYYALYTIARVAPGETVLIEAELGTGAIAAYSIARWLAAKPRLFRCAEEGPQILNGEIVIDLSQPDFFHSLANVDRNIQARAWVHGTKIDEQLAIAGLIAPNAHELIFSEDASNTAAISRVSSHSMISALRLALTSPQIFDHLLTDLAQIILFRPEILEPAQLLTTEEALDLLLDNNQGLTGSTPILSLKNITESSLVAKSSTLKSNDPLNQYPKMTFAEDY